MDGKAFVESVDDPLRLQDLDTSLVGVDAVLGDDRRPAGLDAGTCCEQSGITGRDGVVDPRRRQRERHGCYQSAEQCAPSPEEMQEGLVRHFARVEVAHQIPRQRRIKEVRRPPRPDQRPHKALDLG